MEIGDEVLTKFSVVEVDSAGNVRVDEQGYSFWLREDEVTPVPEFQNGEKVDFDTFNQGTWIKGDYICKDGNIHLIRDEFGSIQKCNDSKFIRKHQKEYTVKLSQEQVDFVKNGLRSRILSDKENDFLRSIVKQCDE